MLKFITGLIKLIQVVIHSVSNSVTKSTTEFSSPRVSKAGTLPTQFDRTPTAVKSLAMIGESLPTHGSSFLDLHGAELAEHIAVGHLTAVADRVDLTLLGIPSSNL